MTAQFNPNFRSEYESVVKKNIIHNPRVNYEYLPERYAPEVPQRLVGGKRVREMALSSENGHYPSIEAVEDSDMGGFYGRAKHPIRVGSGRKMGGIGILKQAQHRVEPRVNEMDMDYIGGAHSFQPHVTGRAPRLTNAIKQQILASHPELMQHHLLGGKIDWAGIWKEIKKGMGYVNKGAKVIGTIAKHPVTRKVLEYATGEDYGDTLDTIGEGAKYAHDISGLVSGMGRYHMHGRGFWKDFGEGFKKGFKGTANVVSKVAPVAALLAPEFAPAIGAVGLASGAVNKAMGGRHRRRYGGASSGGAHYASSGGKRGVGHAKNQARGALIRQIMREKGCTLGQASSYIKQHNIPF